VPNLVDRVVRRIFPVFREGKTYPLVDSSGKRVGINNVVYDFGKDKRFDTNIIDYKAITIQRIAREFSKEKFANLKNNELVNEVDDISYALNYMSNERLTATDFKYEYCKRLLTCGQVKIKFEKENQTIHFVQSEINEGRLFKYKSPFQSLPVDTNLEVDINKLLGQGKIGLQLGRLLNFQNEAEVTAINDRLTFLNENLASDGVIVTGMNETLKELNTPMQNIYAQYSKVQRDAVANVTGMSDAILNNDFTDEQWKAFYQSCIIPIVDSFLSHINALIYGKQEVMKGNKIIQVKFEIQKSTVTDTMKYADKIMYNGILSPNQFMKEMGLPEIGDIGDIHFTNRNALPLTEEALSTLTASDTSLSELREVETEVLEEEL
jgi:hypothetical protein